MKTGIKLLILTVVTGLTWVVFSITWNTPLAAQVSTGVRTPITVTIKDTSFDEVTGGVLTSKLTVYAYRSDGSHSRTGAYSLGYGLQSPTREVFDAKTGIATSISDEAQSISQHPYPENVREKSNLFDVSCGATSQSKREVIGGVETILVSREDAHKAQIRPHHRRLVWRAPSYGCVELKSQVWLWPPQGDPKLVLSRDLVNVALGEPDPKLFDIPSYTERKPSQVVNMLTQLRRVSPRDPAKLKSLDARYDLYHTKFGRQK